MCNIRKRGSHQTNETWIALRGELYWDCPLFGLGCLYKSGRLIEWFEGRALGWDEVASFEQVRSGILSDGWRAARVAPFTTE